MRLNVVLTGLVICTDVFRSIPRGVLLDSLSSILIVTTLVATTSLIALKIVLVTRQSPVRRSYARIVDVLIHSAALVSIVDLSITILQLVDYVDTFKLSTTRGIRLYQVTTYLTYMSAPLTVCTLNIRVRDN